VRWIAKAAVQKALSWCPGGERVNYLLQHRLTRQYPRSDDQFVHWTKLASQHLDAFLKLGPRTPLPEVAFYEFGTGWDLIIPLTYHGLGVTRQTVVDIDAHLRFDLVNDALRRFTTLEAEIERNTGRSLRRFSAHPIRTIEELRTRLGIAYLAPSDARDTGLPAASFDFISSTATLEHIPEVDVSRILTECRRILRPGGLISCRVDMVDHFSYFDPGISAYNFLKFSDPVWRLVNSPLNFTNRLRHSDYLRIIRAAGFEVLSDEAETPSASDLEVLRGMTIGPRFRDAYSLEDLGVKRMSTVVRKGGPVVGGLQRDQQAPSGERVVS
jgi:SAM-dependent methyltransferase